MDIDRLNPTPDARPAGGGIADLLARLRAAGSVEAEVVRVLREQLLLRSELGEILTRNRLDLRPGDRVRIRLAGSVADPVLRASPAPERPVTIASAELPRLARSLPVDRPVLAEILRVLPQATRIRFAGQIHTLPMRIESGQRPLLGVEHRPATRTIELQPLERASIYRALLRQLLPRQAAGDADSLVRLLDGARQRPAEAPLPPRAVAARGPISDASTGAAPLTPVATTKPVKSPAGAIDSPPRPAAPDAAVRTDATPPRPRYPSIPPSARAYSSPAAAAKQTGDTAPAAGSNAPRVAPAPRAPAPAPAPAAASTPPAAQSPAPKPAPHTSSVTPASAPAGAAPSAGDVVRRGIDPLSPPSATRSRAPEAVANAALPAPLARLLEWLPRSAELDAPRLRHWIELLGFARPPAADGTRPPDLMDWLRQLRSFDSSARDAAAPLARRGVPASADSQSTASDNREAPPALPRDLLKLAEQALTQNLLQRVAAGLQQDTQQPLNLSLTLPFVDEAGVRPLRLEFEQRGRRGESGGEPAWDVRVSFEFGALGPITCHLVLAGRALAASFYCQSGVTRERVEAALPDLRRRLDAAGFDPGELHSFAGQPRAREPAATLASEFLIDLEA